ncbi:hypothetical protein G6O69_12745 [Pseudenhygromyxa sp. WMMC2535]|uniref:alpha-amylase family glycosyl hydrolase n=1 Tax=Pseudenhygromyxa sp. WMMC2535 TaxID=2712867 RepID=UPI0015553260|nr:alpha-amylase family glycosyl hydrolase [Pseudenhygromyxa sp. WMMC2535]NVB38702.1 hypothetical protein [Pseudenhygromyxa sp. WMMC2535]
MPSRLSPIFGLILGSSLPLTLTACGDDEGDDEAFGADVGVGTGEDTATTGFTTSDSGEDEVDTDSSSEDSGSTSDETDTGTETGDTDTDTGEADSGEDDSGGELLGERPVIYELVVRHFGNDNQTRAENGSLAQNGVGKFNDISDAAAAALVELGVTHVWLSGALRQASLTNYAGYDMPAEDPDAVRGRAGWLYAIRDAYDLSPDYALDPTMRAEEFAALLDRLHAVDLRVLIDLVPNHVARGYASVIQPATDFGLDDDQSVDFDPNNNFYYLPGEALSLSRPGSYNPAGFTFDGAYAPEDGAAGATPRRSASGPATASPAAESWYDSVRLDWGYDPEADLGEYSPTPDTWLKFDAIVAHWQAVGVDGFRVLHADLVPAEAWTWLIDAARARDAEVVFFADLAEPTDNDAALASPEDLLDAGFDAVDHDAGYAALKQIYQGAGSQSDYAAAMFALDDELRPRHTQYLEQHDARRLASPVVASPSPASASGFGSKAAGYQLAPLVYLYGDGPILVYNGQEVGELGAGAEGFGREDGRTSVYDYWSLEALSRWANGGAFDGGELSQDELALRHFYADLLALSQDESAVASNYWGLEYFNNPGVFGDCPDGFYSFARFEPGSGRAMVVVANFSPGASASGQLRLPEDLLEAVGFASEVGVRMVLDEGGTTDEQLFAGASSELASAGFSVSLGDQRAAVFVIE